MNKLLKTCTVTFIILLVLAMGTPIRGPLVQAQDDFRSERFDLDLSRHDRGELWDDDSHEVLRDQHHEREHDSDREREFNREHERERDDRRETHRDRDRDSLRDQFRDHDRDHEGLREREPQDD